MNDDNPNAPVIYMDAMLKQDTRFAELRTPLGKDVLVLVRFDATEGLSELFEYRIEALAAKEVDLDAILGRPCSVTVKLYGKERHFNGIAVEAQWTGVRQEHHVYRLVLRPWLWLCSRTSDCRFFQDKTASEIIQEVWRDRGFNDFRANLNESYPKLEYCVQYRETDLAFVSRLMEQHGIYYFFEHTSDKHTLVMADSMSSHQAVPGLGQIDFIALGNSERRDRQHIYHVVSERRFRTGKVELNDYYELTPNADLKADKKGTARYNKSDMEFYDYPGKYKKKSDGEKYAKVVLEAEQALDERRHTGGNAVNLFPGGTTKLQGHHKTSENKDYLVVRCSHLYVAEHYRSGTGAAEEDYSGNFEFLPKENKVFRAPIVTPKPLIHGIQTAKVVGKQGEEIDVDEHGRILVEFFWDRKKKQSCRIRVAEVWASKKWGGQFIPRVGMEVVVEFIEGDPDRPLVTGAVYNGDNKHPYELPANKTQSGVKSDSSKGGGGYNQVMFEDKKNSEEIDLHAQKHYKLKILDTETREIGERFTSQIAGPNSRKTTLLRGDDDLKIATGNQNVTIAMNQTSTIGMNRTTTITTSDTTTAGTTITITAGTSLTLICGGSIISMTPASISLVSSTINMAAGAVNIAAPLQVAPTITAPLVNGRP
ncbi:MAG TPA: type VI secretion system tip protein TssI/VgrG [Sphingomicrobium sp.]|nr:type VI secretion system tip protein TssI/VgrG [Sphingomicrobium sp.]